MDKSLIVFFVCGLFIVSIIKQSHPKLKEKLKQKFYENNLFSFDRWSIIHLILTFCLVFYYDFTLIQYIFIVVFWELVENQFVVNESKKDIIGDLLIAIPATLYLVFYKT